MKRQGDLCCRMSMSIPLTQLAHRCTLYTVQNAIKITFQATIYIVKFNNSTVTIIINTQMHKRKSKLYIALLVLAVKK